MEAAGLLMLPALLQTAPGALDSTRESWRLLDLPPAWVIVLVLLPAAAAIASIAYWREPISRRSKRLLGSLRFVAILLLLTVLSRPVRVEHQESVHAAEVAVLVDDSASMLRKDAYSSDTDLAQAITRLVPEPLGTSSRLELVQSILPRELLTPLGERGYRVHLYRFSETTTPLAALEEADGRGHRTHIGDALSQILSTARGGNLTDVVVVSDGRNNGGVAPLDVGTAAHASGIPVHTVLVGDTHPEKNLVVELVEAPESVLEGDEIALRARVRSRGLGTAGRAHVVLEELEREGARTVAEEDVDLAEEGERVVLVAPPSTGGWSSTERRFRITVPPQPEETLRDDNSVEVSVHVDSEKIRVLFVDAYPRWEYRILKDLLKRADDRISVQCYLMSATHGFPQESSRDLPSLAAVPTERRELLDHYDVIILGDINPYAISPDPAKGEEFVASLTEFVERGGGLCLIAGEIDNPRSVAGTEMAKLYPVELDTSGALTYEWDTKNEVRPVLENPLEPHEIVRLDPDPETNRRLWEEPEGLHGFYWFQPVTDSKPGSLVLLRHPTLANAHGRYPLLVLGYYPSGRTMFLAIDSTWLWQKRYQKVYHERFWRNAMRWLALGRLRGGDRRWQLEALRSTYDLDERVTLEARVLDADFQPGEEASQAVSVTGPDGAVEDLSLALVPGRTGIYRGTFERDRPGLYRASIEVGGQRVASAEVEIVLPSRENADPTPDPEGLAALARVSGGKAVHLARVRELSSEFPGGEERREPISSQLNDAWDNWGTLILALVLLSAEWVARKRVDLI
jgi:hypothetical protein